MQRRKIKQRKEVYSGMGEGGVRANSTGDRKEGLQEVIQVTRDLTLCR